MTARICSGFAVAAVVVGAAVAIPNRHVMDAVKSLNIIVAKESTLHKLTEV